MNQILLQLLATSGIALSFRYNDTRGRPDCPPDTYHCHTTDRVQYCEDGCTEICYDQMCDGEVQCPDGDDEDPDFCRCPDGMFECVINTQCIWGNLVCNGIQNCPNNEDEESCANGFFGPTERSFADSQCKPFLEEYDVNHIHECMYMCSESKLNDIEFCNAINYSEDLKHCEMFKCPEPFPSPAEPRWPVYRGYIKLHTEDTK